MNLRIVAEPTPTRRLAALLRSYLNRFLNPPPAVPDYADIAHDIELYVNRELFRIARDEIKEAIAGCGADPPAYLRKRMVTLEALMQQNEREIQRDGLLGESERPR